MRGSVRGRDLSGPCGPAAGRRPQEPVPCSGTPSLQHCEPSELSHVTRSQVLGYDYTPWTVYAMSLLSPPTALSLTTSLGRLKGQLWKSPIACSTHNSSTSVSLDTKLTGDRPQWAVSSGRPRTQDSLLGCRPWPNTCPTADGSRLKQGVSSPGPSSRKPPWLLRLMFHSGSGITGGCPRPGSRSLSPDPLHRRPCEGA